MATRAPKAAAAKSPPPALAEANLVLVCGSDEYRVGKRAREVLLGWCPGGLQDPGLEVMDGVADTVDEAVGCIRRVIEAVSTVGLFGGAKVVWLREASFFSESGPGKFETTKAAVAELTEELKRGLMPGQRLLISASKVHRAYAFYKTCKATGVVFEHDTPDKPREQMDQALTDAQEFLRAEGLKAPHPAIQLLVDQVGFQTRQLAQEAAKLATYLGDRRDLAEALGQRNLALCLRLFRQLIFQKESPVLLLMGIQGRVRDMLVLRTMLDRGYLRVPDSGYGQATWSDDPEAVAAAQAVAGQLLKGHPYRLLLLARSASGFRAAELRRWYQLVVQTHERMMSGGASPELLMELMLIEMLQGGAVRAR